jgi:release factor glutamine methyltransferase
MSRAVAGSISPAAGRGAPRRASGSTVGDLLLEISRDLAAGGLADPEAESRDLIAAVLEQPRLWPALHRDDGVDEDVAARVRDAAGRRLIGAPFAYAVGLAAFRHLTLRVDERVLIPRQETEVLVDLVLTATTALGGAVVADVGTGSGAIALALATEGGSRFARVIGSDVSLGALAVAAENSRRMSAAATIEFRHGSGLSPLVGEVLDVLVANPPYIAFDEAAELPRSVRDWEPMQALLSADAGLALTHEIVAGAPALLAPGGLIALECDSRRCAAVVALLERSGHYRDVRSHADLAGRQRFALAHRA